MASRTYDNGEVRVHWATTITPTEDGPLRVSGRVPLQMPDGADRGRATELYLCRCGRSANKPLCDGSHNEGCAIGEAQAQVVDRDEGDAPLDRGSNPQIDC